jgi:hypothetical protein
MNIGDLVIFRGRLFVLRGLDPMSVPERHAHLEDLQTAERFRVLLDDVHERPDDRPV